MDDLIEALQIFRKYANEKHPTNCEHDQLYIMGVDEVSKEDEKRLDELGFFREDDEGWSSYKFGNA